MINILLHTLKKRRQIDPTCSLFFFFSETDHLNYKVSFIGFIITQQYANQIQTWKKISILALTMRVTHQQFPKHLLLEMKIILPYLETPKN